MSIKYNNIVSEVSEKWKIGNDDSVMENAETFISFALHLFFGAEGTLQTKLITPTDGVIIKSHKDSCKRNINKTLFNKDNTEYYTKALTVELNQQYDNKNLKMDINEQYLSKKNQGLKAAIIAVIECFVSKKYKKRYSYDIFNLWLNGRHIPNYGVFVASEIIHNWSKFRINKMVSENNLKNNFKNMMLSINNIDSSNNDSIQSFDNYADIEPVLNNLENKLKFFKNYIQKLNKSTLKELVSDLDPNSFYNNLLMDDGYMELKIFEIDNKENFDTGLDSTTKLEYDRIINYILKNMLDILLKYLKNDDNKKETHCSKDQ